MSEERSCEKCTTQDNGCCFKKMADFIASGLDITQKEKEETIAKMRNDAFKRGCPNSDYTPFPEHNVVL